jgi:hypothetical protein
LGNVCNLSLDQSLVLARHACRSEEAATALAGADVLIERGDASDCYLAFQTYLAFRGVVQSDVGVALIVAAGALATIAIA